MKVYLSNYRDHWISPYTILDHMFFWTDWSKCNRDKSIEFALTRKYIDRPDWCDKWSDRLEPISEAIRLVLDKIHPRISYVKIDRWDTWSMDSTLSPIILPMLKKLKLEKQGSALVDLDDVPEHLRFTTTEDYDSQRTFDFYKETVTEENVGPNVHTRWDWVMGEMIWAFEQLNDENWENQYWITHPEIDFTKHPEDEGKTSVPVRWIVEGDADWEGMEKHRARIQNGLRLFGVYFQGLWD